MAARGRRGICSGCGRSSRSPTTEQCQTCWQLHQNRSGEFRDGYMVSSEELNSALLDACRDGRLYCSFSDVELVEGDPGHPASPEIEHTDPAGSGGVTIAAQVINMMKGTLPAPHFRALVIELGKKFDGQPYNAARLRDLIYSSPRRKRN